jgi:penicillin amidase
MIDITDQEAVVEAVEGTVSIRRNEYGIPVIKADNFRDMMYGVGMVHACDRGMQVEVTRLLAKGRLSENLPPSEDLMAMDINMRRYDFWGFARKQAGKLDGEELEECIAFCRGVNDQFDQDPPAEFGLMSYEPEPWTPADCIVMAKIIVLVDMDETQGWIKKFIVQMVQKGVTVDMLREMFVYMTEDPDAEYLEKLSRVKIPEPIVPESVKWAAAPRLRTSSNWMISGRKTVTGKPILCGSPELDAARLPALWQEIILEVGDFYCVGIFVPGIPLPSLGRTKHLSWSPTYGCMDVMDYYLEEVKDGRYRRGDEWVPFRRREEVIKIKDGEPRTVVFYENEHGVLDGEPEEDGCYLSLAMSMRDAGAKALVHFARAYRSETVQEAMDQLARVDCIPFNWGLADDSGNIGYQMSGMCPIRPDGWRGFLPLPGWDEAFDWKGIYGPEKNPRLLNPEEGYFMTSNQDLNHLSDVHIQSMPMSGDRAERISELLAAADDHSVEGMMKIQYNVYGKHAEWFMPIIRPLLPDTENGRLLADWDLYYRSDSLGASLFESVYFEIVRTVFGDNGLGREVIEYVLDASELYYVYYGQFDHVLLSEDSLWFGGRPRDDVFREAVARGLEVEPVPFGGTRRVMMKNIVYGDMTEDFNHGPIEIIGSRGTVSQGAIFRAPGGRIGTFAPVIRFIADLSGDKYWSCLAGGPSEKPASPWYTSGVQDWLDGNYKLIERGPAGF